MNKAILVMDMPRCCDDCNFCYYSDGKVPICFYRNLVVNESKAKPDWCPLKPLPEEVEVNYGDDTQDYQKGYNAYLEYILWLTGNEV